MVVYKSANLLVQRTLNTVNDFLTTVYKKINSTVTAILSNILLSSYFLKHNL